MYVGNERGRKQIGENKKQMQLKQSLAWRTEVRGVWGADPERHQLGFKWP